MHTGSYHSYRYEIKMSAMGNESFGSWQLRKCCILKLNEYFSAGSTKKKRERKKEEQKV